MTGHSYERMCASVSQSIGYANVCVVGVEVVFIKLECKPEG
jgi:hypothetical protein